MAFGNVKALQRELAGTRQELQTCKQQLSRMQTLTEENENYRQQMTALQGILRETAAETEKWRQLAQGASNEATSTVDPEALQARINKQQALLEAAKSDLEEANKQLSAATTQDPSDESAVTAAQELVNQRSAAVVELESTLEELQGEAENSSESAIAETRERNRQQREQRIRQEELEARVEQLERELEESKGEAATHSEAADKAMQNMLDKVGEKARDLASARAEIDGLKTDLSTLRSQHESTLEELKKQEELAKTTGSAADARKLKEAETRVQELTAQVEALGASNSELQEQATTYDDALRKKQSEFEAVDKRAANALAEIQSLKKQVTDLSGQRDRLKTALDDTEKQLSKAEKAGTELREKYEELREDSEGALRERGQLREEVEALRGRMVTMSSEMSVTRQAAKKAEEERDALQAKLHEAEDRMDEMHVEHKMTTKLVNQKNRQLQTELGKLVAEKDEFKAAQAGLKKQIADLQKRIATDAAKAVQRSAASGVGPAAQAAQHRDGVHRDTSNDHQVQRANQNRTPLRRASSLRSPAPSDNSGERGGGRGMPLGSPDAHTATLLTEKLQRVLQENEEVRVRVRYLEGIIQDVQRELGDSRQLVKHMSSSRGLGSAEGAAAVRAAKASSDPWAAIATLLEKSLHENARLRRDMRRLVSSNPELAAASPTSSPAGSSVRSRGESANISQLNLTEANQTPQKEAEGHAATREVEEVEEVEGAEGAEGAVGAEGAEGGGITGTEGDGITGTEGDGITGTGATEDEASEKESGEAMDDFDEAGSAEGGYGGSSSSSDP